MLTVKQLDKMSQSGIEKIDKTGLVDIRGIMIDTNLPLEQRMINYLEQVKNPYCFLCGDSVVRIRFEPTGNELKNKMKDFFISLKKV
ncbi:DUF6870 family protein [Candidatus Galacturonibacter soehngenii]|uniref:DUF6870 domain-containing protein n=1 Tax=Candidatus Galacturonatibacter soehngenii TaxID=2307010 RepID=A0A7V7UBC6_9FIRM|nr:hypothetical protein [Candidatus Galacturonibacter soehngenii]KAB1437973.1 hypothetical protein F7O84_10330 [Candidatus Galacturonibacter soehngenii]